MRQIRTNKATHDEWIKYYKRGHCKDIVGNIFVNHSKKVGTATVWNAIKTGVGNAVVITAITEYYAEKTI